MICFWLRSNHMRHNAIQYQNTSAKHIIIAKYDAIKSIIQGKDYTSNIWWKWPVDGECVFRAKYKASNQLNESQVRMPENVIKYQEEKIHSIDTLPRNHEILTSNPKRRPGNWSANMTSIAHRFQSECSINDFLCTTIWSTKRFDHMPNNCRTLMEAYGIQNLNGCDVICSTRLLRRKSDIFRKSLFNTHLFYNQRSASTNP